MDMTKRTANMMLFVIAAFWGSGFIVTRMALDANVSAGFVNFSRGLIFAILAFLFFHKKLFKMTVRDFKVGLIAGLLNFGGVLAQTVGVKYTTPSNNAFITSTYVVIVPFIAWFIYKKSLKIKSFISIAFCLFGMAILSGVLSRGAIINIGDAYSLLSALIYAGSIAYNSYGARKTDATIVAFMLAIVQAIGGLGAFLFFDGGQLNLVDWQAAIIPLLYMGIICSFAAQTVQVFAQKYTSATTAGLIMMLEGPFGSLFSVAFGFESLTLSMIIGGSIIMGALLLMEMNFEQFRFMLSRKFEVEQNRNI